MIVDDSFKFPQVELWSANKKATVTIYLLGSQCEVVIQKNRIIEFADGSLKFPYKITYFAVCQ